MKRLILALAVGAVCASCQTSKSPTQPDSVTPPPSAGEAWSLTGQVINAITQQALAGVQLLNTQTNASGVFELNGTGARSAQRVTLSATGYLTRETTISSGTNNPIIDLIPDSLITTYRELVRNGFETPDALEPIRRWTSAPKFYIDTTMPIGIKVAEGDLVRIEEGIRSAVPAFTGGRFQAETVQRGTNPPVDKGWILVKFVNDSTADYCGRAYVGANPGQIEFNYNRCDCGGGVRVRPRTIKHEVGHALGFWHRSERGTLMYGVGSCADVELNQAERDAARIAYGRPMMNADPDSDPTGTAFMGMTKRLED